MALCPNRSHTSSPTPMVMSEMESSVPGAGVCWAGSRGAVCATATSSLTAASAQRPPPGRTPGLKYDVAPVLCRAVHGVDHPVQGDVLVERGNLGLARDGRLEMGQLRPE